MFPAEASKDGVILGRGEIWVGRRKSIAGPVSENLAVDAFGKFVGKNLAQYGHLYVRLTHMHD